MKGVFSEQGLLELVQAGRIIPRDNFSLDHIGPASIDLGITGEIYKVATVVKPRQNTHDTVRSLLPMMGAVPHPFEEPMLVGAHYLAKASIDINFSPGMYGYANAKSTSGRLFNFARTLMDGVAGFDTVDRRHEGLSGELWLSIDPLAFPILPSTIERYAQLRVFSGDTRFSNQDLLDLLAKKDLLFRSKTLQPYLQRELNLFTHSGSILGTLHAKGDMPIGYVTRNPYGLAPINLSARNILPQDYFEPVFATQLISGDDSSWGIWLEPDRHYLLSTNEAFKIPEDCSLELAPLNRYFGDVFTHYAGFCDPGFFGTITLEVYSPRRVFIRHKDPIIEGVLERIMSPTVSYAEKGNYQGQMGTRLPKQFSQYPT